MLPKAVIPVARLSSFLVSVGTCAVTLLCTKWPLIVPIVTGVMSIVTGVMVNADVASFWKPLLTRKPQ